MNALELVASRAAAPFVRSPRRVATAGMGLNEMMATLFAEGALPLTLQTTLRGDRELVENSFAGYVYGLYARNPVVFASLAMRARVFSEMRFAFQQLRNSRPGQLFGTPDLRILENPEPGKTTGDMLAAAILDADLAGDAFLLRRPDRIRRLRPDWTTVVYGAKVDKGLGGWDPDAEVIGYGHYPGGLGSGLDTQTFLPEEIAHFFPNRDPLARNRGMSLLTAGLREIQADSSAAAHKLAVFQNAATSNLLVTYPTELGQDAANEWIDLFEDEHRGALNAYKALYIGGGPQVTSIGASMQEMTFKELQGSAETRIAALTGFHPVVLALSEGLQGSGLNAGNYKSAKRGVADATLRPLWRNMAGSLQEIIPTPPGSRLWYDERDVAFLREDLADSADIMDKNAGAMRTLVDGGFEPTSVIDAITSGDMTRLVHTGLVSVQLQPPGTTAVPGAGGPLKPAGQVGAFRATRDFWPLENPWADYGEIDAGQILEAGSPVVRTFPSMFEPVADKPGVIVTRAQVLAAQTKLLGAGKDAGYDSVAQELNVHRETVRRRLKETK